MLSKMVALHTFAFLAYSTAVAAQSTCVSDVEPHPGLPTLYYKPYVPPQVAPTSTVWRQFVYETFFAVNCDYATVVKIDDNQPQSGHFTAITTVDALTLTRIECIQETAVITRRDRGQATGTPSAYLGAAVNAHKQQKRATTSSSVSDFAEQMSAGLSAQLADISFQGYEYLIQVNTALFAINLYNSGFDLNGTCTVLRDPVTQARLYAASVDPVQAASIICFAAEYGLDLNRTNTQLLADLVNIIYSINVRSGFDGNTTESCQGLDFNPLGYLGIDESGLQTYLCGPDATTSAEPTASVPVTSASVSATGSSNNTSPVESSAPFANSTVSGQMNVTAPWGSGTYQGPTAFTGATGTTGSAGTAPTATASDTFSIVFPNATSNANDSFARVPPTPISPPIYAVWTTSTTQQPRLPQY